ncbi:MAG: gliding motility protein GldC [Chlorobiaceae bacterium]|nr:gliding motility protein GldC [Chlorobiaceae bacterium]MBA4309982.1 gliding motility protein GldC [Chlorobiaceae bacterium]
MSKNSSIIFNIDLDENNIPTKIKWSATDSDVKDEMESSAFLISVWDQKNKSTLGLDLWTKEMTIEEMQFFFHQTLLKMSDTFYRSTKDSDTADFIKSFADDFVQKLKLLNEE